MPTSVKFEKGLLVLEKADAVLSLFRRKPPLFEIGCFLGRFLKVLVCVGVNTCIRFCLLSQLGCSAAPLSLFFLSTAFFL